MIFHTRIWLEVHMFWPTMENWPTIRSQWTPRDIHWPHILTPSLISIANQKCMNGHIFHNDGIDFHLKWPLSGGNILQYLTPTHIRRRTSYMKVFWHLQCTHSDWNVESNYQWQENEYFRSENVISNNQDSRPVPSSRQVKCPGKQTNRIFDSNDTRWIILLQLKWVSSQFA